MTTPRTVIVTGGSRGLGEGIVQHFLDAGDRVATCARSETDAVRAWQSDPAYADRYLTRVARLAAVDPDAEGDAALTTEAARHVALWMTYQDTIHVAQQKIRRRRIEGVRAEAKAVPGQLVNVKEYLHPQVEEITDTLPTRLGRWLAGSSLFARLVGRVTRNGIVVNTTGIIGFTLLWMMARFRPLRPRSLRFGREQTAIDAWLDRAVAAAATDADLAREIVECQGVLKGYGATHHHGQESFGLLMEALDGRVDTAAELARLRAAALADEDGGALRAALAERSLRTVPAAPTGS